MNLIVLYVLAGVIIIAILIINFRKNIFPPPRKREPVAVDISEDKPEPGVLEVQIYDDNRTMYKAMITESMISKIKEKHGSLGRGWDETGKQVFALRKTLEGEYIPTSSYMLPTLKSPPEEIYDVYQHDDTEIALDITDTRGILSKYGAILLFSGVALFIVVIAAIEFSK